MEEKRYFGEPFKSRKVEQKDYVNIVEPHHEGDITTRIDLSRYNGKLKHEVNNILGDPRSEAELIQTYREISEHQDVDFAIEEIVNEIFVTDGEAEPISLNLDSIEELSKEDKEKIKKEFQYILNMLNFSRDAFEIFKRFYIDSRLYYYKVVDPQNIQEGIQELRYIDPISIRKVKEIITKQTQNVENQQITDIVDTNEYFVYSPQNNMYSMSSGCSGYGNLQGQGDLSGLGASLENANMYKLNSYSVAYVSSGMYDHRRNCVKGHLHKVIKPLNDLINLETHMIIYRVARAPERRVFYIDTGALPPKKAMEYINNVQDSYRREVNYDSTTGRIRSDTKTISMHEDFWLPRSSTGKGTEVDTLQGASNLSAIEDIEYMDKKFKTSLNVPLARFDSENVSSFLFGTGNGEMRRDEIKFQKFIGRLRSKFNGFFRDILGTQIITKGIMDLESWEEIENMVTFDYVKDTYVEESRKFAVMEQKAEVAKNLEELEGKYVSRDYIWREVLGFTDEEIEQQKIKIKEEKEEFGEDDGF